jgi:hypothetical protein
MSFRLGSFIKSFANKVPTRRKKAPKSPESGGRLRKLLKKVGRKDAAGVADTSPPPAGDEN